MFLKRVIESFKRHKLPYALVGGHAVALHGVIRGTVDIDLVVKLNKKSYVTAEKALAEIGLLPRLPITAEDVFNFREEYIRNRNLIAWSFVNPDNPIERVDILITEDLGSLKTITKSALGLKLHVVAIDELIRMKKKSGRPQDIEDVKALEYMR